jgi:glycosyltransferase involved in cell wall biosynthesis
MKILYLASSSDFHIDLWTQYFTKHHSVFLFSDKETYVKDQPFEAVSVNHSAGLLGGILNFFKVGSKKIYQINKLISARYYAFKIDTLIESEKIDVVHAHSLYYGYVASFLNSQVPVIFTPMGSDIIIHAQENVIYKYMAHRAFHCASVITGDSLLKQKKGYKVGAKTEQNYIIQNGVDSSIFYPKANTLKQDFHVGVDEFLIFSPRAITPLYNIDIILDALFKLKESNHRFKCMFSFSFGGEYYSKLKKKVTTLGLEDYVIWLGSVKYEDMQLYYNASDLVISVPSSDSSPKSVYEAMFCGKPIIISNLEWSHELLDELECVCRVDVRNSDQLFDSIKRIIYDPIFAGKISKNSLQLVHKFFDYEVNMKKMERIMLEVINND